MRLALLVLAVLVLVPALPMVAADSPVPVCQRRDSSNEPLFVSISQLYVFVGYQYRDGTFYGTTFSYCWGGAAPA